MIRTGLDNFYKSSVVSIRGQSNFDRWMMENGRGMVKYGTKNILIEL